MQSLDSYVVITLNRSEIMGFVMCVKGQQNNRITDSGFRIL